MGVCLVFMGMTTSPLSLQESSAAPTLRLQDTRIDGGELVALPWQSGMPLRSFEPQDRAQINLAGEWQKQRFDADAALTMAARDVDTLAALEAEIAGRQSGDFDARDWDTISLPAVENKMPSYAGAGSGPEDYQNGVYYRRSLNIPADWGAAHITLNFLAINYMADVWVNGEWVGYHEGGYTPFSLDVTDAVQVGALNTVFIRVDNPAWGTRSDTVPAVKPDWWNYTGVIQDFYLEATPPLYVTRSDVLTPSLDGSIQVQTVLHNASSDDQTAQFQLTVYDTDRAGEAWQHNPVASSIINQQVIASAPAVVQIPAGEALVISTTIQIPDPALWSPSDPNLYVLQASVSGETGADSFSTQFGIRTITTDATRVLLNGAPIFLAGIARHEEQPDTGRTMTWDRIKADLEMIQALNANFVRTAHYPNHIDTYLLTDRLGLLAAVEIPMWQATALEYSVQAERQIADQMWREMIFSNRNRPSIILWSTNNESRELPFRSAFIERIVGDFHDHYEDGRLLMQSAAADAPGSADASQALLDVAGWTMYFGIFHGSTYYEGTRKFLLDAHEDFPDKPILNTEFGIWSGGGGSSMRRQLEVFDETFRALTEFTALDPDGHWRDDGFVAGMTWWAAFDWYTAHTKVQTMGLYTMDRRTLKPAGQQLQAMYALWANRPLPAS